MYRSFVVKKKPHTQIVVAVVFIYDQNGKKIVDFNDYLYLPKPNNPNVSQGWIRPTKYEYPFIFADETAITDCINRTWGEEVGFNIADYIIEE